MANIGREFIPSPASEAFRLQTYVYTATGGETSVTQADSGTTIKYDLGYVAVYVNGTRLIPGTDYTATTGTSIDGLTALYAGDLVEIIGMPLTPIEDTVSKGAGGTFSGLVDFANGVSAGGNTIAEYGTNGNGEYVRFYNGTQICTRAVDLSDAVDVSSGGVYIGQARVWTFPIEFTGAVSVTGASGRGSVQVWGAQIAWEGTPSNTSVTYRIMLHQSRAGHSYRLMTLAVGRWY